MKNKAFMGILLCSMFSNVNIRKAEAANAYQGYTFYASGTYSYLVDMSGAVLHTWKASGSAVCVSYLLEDGSVLVPIYNNCSTGSDGAHPHGRIQRISWDGSILWDYKFCPSGYVPGYDIEPMPNGNVLIPADNRSSAGIIYEVKPNGTSGGDIVWQYALPDSLNTSGSGMGGMGGTYINSVSYNPDLDMILIDLQTPVRKFVVIDHSGSGKVVFTYTIGTTGRVHGAIWSSKYFIGTKTVMPDADTNTMRINNLLVVNNTNRVVEVNMTTKQLVKSFTYSFANNEGSVQRLPNGNTLVQRGMDQTTITELDDNGKSVATITAKGRCSRAYRYGPTYAGVSKLNFTLIGKAVISTKTGNKCIYNTASNSVLITLADPNESNARLRIITMDGKTLYSQILNEFNKVFSVENLQAGIYFAEVQSSSVTMKTKFVK